MTVRDLIHDCGGPARVADASCDTDNEVSVEAVFKWYRNGIPEVHWPLIMSLSDTTIERIYNTNRLMERRKRRLKRRRPNHRTQVRAA